MNENHLPHIYERLNGINKWLIGVLVTLCFTLLALVGNLIVK